eukprot:TRINITY_DN82260_c0_g1_i1.p1 TRINITY_DN82260_c0_g1~~TRINITY_DN82260_c0_g1_i1.p1  ORF type:complete len:429 (+),score=45.08 TRINITY_DN82260_c0_g1_i1:65-1351(+)
MAEYEFGGPIGACGIMLGLPIVIYFLFFSCAGTQVDGQSWCVPGVDLTSLSNVQIPPLEQFFSMSALLLFVGWFAFQVCLERCLPGDVVKGVVLKTGDRLDYPMNGHLAFWVSLLAVCIGSCLAAGRLSLAPMTWLYDNYLQLITASTIFSFALSTYLYASSFAKGRLLADGGQTGNFFYDYFIGRELNPRIGSFDLKCFCELRPGLIGWAVLNLGMAAKQYEVRGGSISSSMLLVNLLQGLYVWDALFQERAILTTMDITTDGFGFMLAFGDLAWVPFTYSLQARYLVHHDPGLSMVAAGVIATLCLIGYVIFRGANSQKDAFRRDPTAPGVAHLKYMKTERGTSLLTSGFWGLARKINYTGDWLMGLCWCMFCGTGSGVPYFYAIYFGVLLIHRATRDDHFCSLKYGADWARYKKQVPCVFIPGLI